MKKALKKLFSRQTATYLSFFAMVALFAYFFDVAEVFAQDPGNLIRADDVPDRIASNSGGYSFRDLILNFLNFFLGFLGLLAVLMVIYGGFLYMTAAGDDSKTESGKKVILYAVIGIMIILISFALVNTVLSGLAVGQDVN